MTSIIRLPVSPFECFSINQTCNLAAVNVFGNLTDTVYVGNAGGVTEAKSLSFLLGQIGRILHRGLYVDVTGSKGKGVRFLT